MTAELTTAADCISYMGDSSASSTIVSACLNAAESMIARYCGRKDTSGNNWLTASHTEYLDGEYADMVPLRFTPITAVSSVTIIYASGSTRTVTLTDLTMDGIEIASLSASVDGKDGQLWMRSNPEQLWNMNADIYGPSFGLRSKPNYGGGRKRIKVVYTGGYANAAAVPDLTLAAQMVTANIYRYRTVNPNITSTTLGQFSESYGDASTGSNRDSQWLGDAASLLQDHRRIVV